MVDHLPDCSAWRNRRQDAGGDSRQDAGATSAAGRFPRARRLQRHADFRRVYEQGRRHFAAHMTVFYLERAGGEGPRVGLTVGRVLGGAVERNRIKRRLREAVRASLNELGAAVDVVINPKKSALTAEFAVLREEVKSAFQKIQSSDKSSVLSLQSSGKRREQRQ